MAQETREVFTNGVLVATEQVEVPDEVIAERTLQDRADFRSFYERQFPLRSRIRRMPRSRLRSRH